MAKFVTSYTTALPDSLLFKKIDSSLRGNVAAELASALAERRKTADQGERIVAVMAPAFPLNGRTTVDGYQLVHGRPLHETELWIHEMGAAHIPSLVAEAGLHAATLDLSRVRSGVEKVRLSMLDAAPAADVLVCDAEIEEDLYAIASASLALGRKTVWVGSAGLARHLPLAAGLVSKTPPPSISVLCDGPSLFVIGSTSSVSHDQASQLSQYPAVNTIDVPPRTLISGAHLPHWAEIAGEIEKSLREGRDTLVKVNGSESIDPKQCRSLTDALGALLSPYRPFVGSLVASGGETARAVLAAWGVTTLQVLGEVETGLPYSAASFGELAMPVLTKAGSFGSPETLLKCRQFLDNLKRGAGTSRRSAHKP